MSEQNLPPVEQYPGYFPPATSFWSRTKVAVACTVGGLLLGLAIGVGGSTAEAGDEPEPSGDAVTQADLDEAVAAAEAASAVAMTTAEEAQTKAVAQAQKESRRSLRATLREAEAKHRKALTSAVAKAVAAERRKADLRVAAAVAAANAPSPAPTGGGGGTDPRFNYCYQAIAAGYGPYSQGQDPEYDWYDDADNDGSVCE